MIVPADENVWLMSHVRGVLFLVNLIGQTFPSLTLQAGEEAEAKIP